jgi:uncharacterized protein (DUF58 family)
MFDLGQIGEREDPGQRRADARRRALAAGALVPRLLVEARRLANTVIAGWHGRRKRGIGENFWQFRPMSKASRRAASTGGARRDDHTYVRDREWEAAHTVWLWADLSPSMLYKSQTAPSRRNRGRWF